MPLTLGQHVEFVKVFTGKQQIYPNMLSARSITEDNHYIFEYSRYAVVKQIIFIFGWCLFFFNARKAIANHYWLTKGESPRSDYIMSILNIVQASVAFIGTTSGLIRSCVPWILKCHCSLAASTTVLVITGGCINSILVLFAYQSVSNPKYARWLIYIGIVSTLLTVIFGGLTYFAFEVEPANFNQCAFVLKYDGWAAGKLYVDLTSNFFLSWVYYSMLRDIVRDTGLSVYRALLRNGLVGRFIVLISNIVCAALILSGEVDTCVGELYALDSKSSNGLVC
jgi:hypothetical protein